MTTLPVSALSCVFLTFTLLTLQQSLFQEHFSPALKTKSSDILMLANGEIAGFISFKVFLSWFLQPVSRLHTSARRKQAPVSIFKCLSTSIESTLFSFKDFQCKISQFCPATTQSVSDRQRDVRLALLKENPFYSKNSHKEFLSVFQSYKPSLE